jgi:hypothetical protein
MVIRWAARTNQAGDAFGYFHTTIGAEKLAHKPCGARKAPLPNWKNYKNFSV